MPRVPRRHGAAVGDAHAGILEDGHRRTVADDRGTIRAQKPRLESISDAGREGGKRAFDATAPRDGFPVEYRTLGDDGGNVIIFGRHAEDMVAGEPRVPGDGRAGVDFVAPVGPRERDAPVNSLRVGVDEIPGLTVGVVGVSIVEEERRAASLGQSLGVGSKPEAALRDEFARYGDYRRRLDAVGSVKPARAVQPLTVEHQRDVRVFEVRGSTRAACGGWPAAVSPYAHTLPSS